MIDGILPAILSGVFALVGVLAALAFNFWLYRREIKRIEALRVSEKKQEVIEDLISYRYAITQNFPSGKDAHSVSKFNSALSRVPIVFSHNEECINLYREFGDKFTAEKFHEFIVILMKDVPLDTDRIDSDLLKNVPSVKPGLTWSPQAGQFNPSLQ
jgi:hypothetical protein